MKNPLIILLFAAVSISGCNEHAKLEQDVAMRLITEQFNYPKIIDYDIYCSDPARAKKLLDSGLEKNGMVTIMHTQKLKDVGKSLIRFTDKARPYFLPSPEKNKNLDIQRVKIAEEVIVNLKILDVMDKTTSVEYTTDYKNITPFAALLKMDLKKLKKHTVHFKYSDNGWIPQQAKY